MGHGLWAIGLEATEATETNRAMADWHRGSKAWRHKQPIDNGLTLYKIDP